MKNRAMKRCVRAGICPTQAVLLALLLICLPGIAASEWIGNAFQRGIVSFDENSSGPADLAGRASAKSEQEDYDPLDYWHWRNPLPQGKELKSIAYGNNTFVALAVGTNAVVTSSDGIVWETRQVTDCVGQSDVTYINDAFYSVGDKGICTSSDGITWTKRYVNDDVYIYRIAYGNGTYVATGRSMKKQVGLILTSTDSTHWTQPQYPHTDYSCPTHVVYGNGTFVTHTGQEFLVSPDGINWTKGDSADPVSQVVYLNGTFFAVGYPALILTSQDGSTWTKQSASSAPGSQLRFIGVTWLNGNFVAVASSPGGNVYTSRDAVTWTAGSTGFDEYLNTVVSGNGLVVAAGVNGAILTSPDGTTWAKRSSGSIVELRTVAQGNDAFVAGGTNVIFTSPDGITWKTGVLSDSPGEPFGINDIAYGNGMFVAVGGQGGIGGIILRSPDGGTWTQADLPPGLNAFEHVAYGNSTFVALGDGLAYTTTDGMTWIKSPVENAYYFDALTYADGGFLGVGSDPFTNYIFSSPDGTNWTATSTGIYYLTGIAYGNGTVVAVGVNGVSRGPASVVLTLRNGKSSMRKWPFGAPGRLSVTYAHGTFIVHGGIEGKGVFASSSDGVKWALKAPQLGVVFNALTYGNGTFIGVGKKGAILQSDNACPFEADPSGTTFGPQADNLTVGINTVENGCPAPGVSANRDWITLSGFSFAGNSGSVNVSVAANDSFLNRTGQVAIGSGTFNVTQDGSPCTIGSLIPDSALFGKDGGPGSFTANVTPSDCKWSVRGVPAWIKLTSGSQGMGSGVVTFTVKPNAGKKSRAGSLSIVLARGGAKSKFSVTQDVQ